MAGVVDLLAMIVSKRRSSSRHLIRMPFLGCVLRVASCSTHIASEAAPALRALGFNTNSRMRARPTASMWLSPVWTPATSSSRCTVKEYSKWVEKALGISDLRSRLQAGEAVAAFDFRRDQLKIKWLKRFLKAGFSVSEGSSRRWLVSLVYPTGIMALVEVVDGWDVHNEWRWALPPT
jgi:hypothetical protein